MNELFEVVGKHRFLGGEVTFEGFPCEEGIQSFPVVDVGFSAKEHPSSRTYDVFGDWYETWLDKSARVEDFVCEVTVGGEDNESVTS